MFSPSMELTMREDNGNTIHHHHNNNQGGLDLSTRIRISKFFILTNILFVIGSTLYVAMVYIPYSGLYNDGTAAVSPTTTATGTLLPTVNLTMADDHYDDDAWSDDFIALATDQWISTYSILYLIASLAFVITGLLDLMLIRIERNEYEKLSRIEIATTPNTNTNTNTNRSNSTNTSTPHQQDINDEYTGENENKDDEGECEIDYADDKDEDHTIFFHACCYHCSQNADSYTAYAMIVAGLFGFLSAILTIKYYEQSDTMSWISTTLFFLQGLFMMYARFRGGEKEVDEDGPITLFWILLIADLCFLLGTTFDFVIASIDFYDDHEQDTFDDDDTLPEAAADLSGSILWLVCSLLYLGVSIYNHQKLLRLKLTSNSAQRSSTPMNNNDSVHTMRNNDNDITTNDDNSIDDVNNNNDDTQLHV